MNLKARLIVGGIFSVYVTALLQLDIPLSLVFYKWLLGQEHSLTSSDLQHLDPVIAKSFQQLEDVLHQKQRILSDKSHVSQHHKQVSLCIMKHSFIMLPPCNTWGM